MREEADDQREKNKALIRRYFSAYNTGDINSVLRFVDANHIHHPPGGGEPLDFTGRRMMKLFSSRRSLEFTLLSKIRSLKGTR